MSEDYVNFPEFFHLYATLILNALKSLQVLNFLNNYYYIYFTIYRISV